MDKWQKIRMGLLLVNIRLGRIFTRDTFHEEDHPRDRGGKFSAKGSTGETAHAKIEVSPTGTNRFVKRGFANKQKLMNHWKNGRTHADEFPEIHTAKEYEQKALELIEKPVGGSILGHIDSHGNVIRYDRNTNTFVKGDPSKGIRTMYRPPDGEEYYQTQRAEDLKYGGNT